LHIERLGVLGLKLEAGIEEFGVRFEVVEEG
jgi:hypothetical protein